MFIHMQLQSISRASTIFHKNQCFSIRVICHLCNYLIVSLLFYATEFIMSGEERCLRLNRIYLLVHHKLELH